MKFVEAQFLDAGTFMHTIKKFLQLRGVTLIIAWWCALTPALRIAWPFMSPQPFPLPGYRIAETGWAFIALTMVAICLAVWVTVSWNFSRKHRLFFSAVAIPCFLVAALYVSVPLGIGFATLNMLVKVREQN